MASNHSAGEHILSSARDQMIQIKLTTTGNNRKQTNNDDEKEEATEEEDNRHSE